MRDVVNTQRAETIKLLCQHRQGRDFIAWLFELTRALPAETNPFTLNALSTAFNCGQLDIGQRILAEVVSADPDGFLTILREGTQNDGNLDGNLDGNDTPGWGGSD